MEQDRWCRNSWVKTNELLRNWHLRKPRGPSVGRVPSLQATWTPCRADRWASVGRSREEQRTPSCRSHLSVKSPFGHQETHFGRCLSFPWKVLCPYDLGRSCLRLSVQLASAALSHQILEKMQLYLVLLLISYLLTPIGASILGRCTVAKKLYDGGLNYFEGYSLENSLLNPNLKDTIECAKKIVKGKRGMGAWPVWSKNCQLSDILGRWLDGCNL
ncbi:lysozyme-like protein 4 isoform X2 [Arvicanthis niloticus]|uniref:lysozyme-like protein 4 isoform X2 n=1 Tax=Arvicanthis niloticus TaxID=61156 RepID=UPI00402BBCD0